MIKININNLHWILTRLIYMTPGELFKRFYRHLRDSFRDYFKSISEPSILNFPLINAFSIPDKEKIPKEQKESIIEEANAYINLQWLFFGLKDIYEPKINWHKDVVSNISVPLKLGSKLNIRDTTQVGDVKIIWEKNRHHHLTVLSIAFFLTGNEKYAKEVVYQIIDWIDQNPYLIGINWTQPLELGIRLISWVFCERFLRGSESHSKLFNKNSAFWKSFYEHQKFIYQNYSIGSSANNHLIGEMAGLYISSIIWPIFKESKTWTKFSKNILEGEISKQTYKSGVNKELAFLYQIFDLEFILLCLIETKDFKKEFSKKSVILIRKMIEFLYEMTDQWGNYPNYGDGDDGRAIQLGGSQNSRVSWIFDVSNNIFNTNFKLLKNNNIEAILLNSNSKNYTANEKQRTKNIALSDAGLYLIKEEHNELGDIRILFDAGPVGMGPMSSHGHADALHFTLSVNGENIFIDPGTYTYHEPAFRKYFRSTLAHNTLLINQEDQSIQGGPFLWRRKAKCKIIQWIPEKNIIEAMHDGYKNKKIIHKRKLIYDDGLFIEDNILGKGYLNIEFRFHLAPKFHVQIDNNTTLLSNESLSVELTNSLNILPQILIGTDKGGWYSPRFNVKIPSITLTFQKDVYLPINQIFSFKFKKVG